MSRKRKQPHLNEATTTLHRVYQGEDYSVTLTYQYTPGRPAHLSAPMPDCYSEEPEEYKVTDVRYHNLPLPGANLSLDTYTKEYWEEQLSDHFAQSGDTPC